MKLSELDYYLPKERIAQFPENKRSESKLLVYLRQRNEIVHTKFANICDFIGSDSILVLNNTKTFKARLWGKRKSGGKCEVFIISRLAPRVFEVLLRPKQRLKQNETIYFAHKIKAVILDKKKTIIEFNRPLDFSLLEEVGSLPLPPYIKRPLQDSDQLNYQTIYAKDLGSLATPTAGLHFDEEVFLRLRKNNVEVLYITLHIGYGTFKPVTFEDVRRHYMYPEFIEIPEETANKLNSLKKRKKIIAVGTSSVRALESAYFEGEFHPFYGFSELFIYPGYEFKAVGGIITNFHLPRTSLLALVSAFIGKEKMLSLYQEAISNDYRFYSYGDAMAVF